MSAKIAENTGIDPLLWAKRPQSQQVLDLIGKKAKVDPIFKGIVEKHVADGVCSVDLQIEYVWSFAAQKFVRPTWYQRVNSGNRSHPPSATLPLS